MLGVVAVITNCALIGMAAKNSHWLPEMSTVNAILMFVAIEVRTRHSLLSSLRSKRFCLVSEQRNNEEGDFRF